MFYQTGWTNEPQSIAQIYADTIGLVISHHERFLRVPNYMDEAIQNGYTRIMNELDANPKFLAEADKLQAANLITNRDGSTKASKDIGRYETLTDDSIHAMPRGARDIRSEARHTDKRIDIETALKMVYEEFCADDETYLWAYYVALTDAKFEHCGQPSSNGGRFGKCGNGNGKGRSSLFKRAKTIKERLRQLLSNYAPH